MLAEHSMFSIYLCQLFSNVYRRVKNTMSRKKMSVKYTEGKQNGSLMAHLVDFWPLEELVVWKKQYLLSSIHLLFNV